jgi:hypothetical protein
MCRVCMKCVCVCVWSTCYVVHVCCLEGQHSCIAHSRSTDGEVRQSREVGGLRRGVRSQHRWPGIRKAQGSAVVTRLTDSGPLSSSS